MSYPPPPGLRAPTSSSSTPQPPSSLPPRPPASAGGFKPAFSAGPTTTHSAPGASNYGGNSKASAPSSGYNAFTSFAPRSVASPGFRNNTATPPTYSAAPQPSYSSGPQVNAQPAGYGPSAYGASSAPSIQNPFPLPGQAPAGGYVGQQASYDPDEEAQIAQWQSAYGARDDKSKPLNSTTGTSEFTSNRDNTSTPETTAAAAAKTVVRSGGGQTWQDSSLLEWDPAHFRLFVGNLAGEVTDESLLKAFSKYPSVQKARVIRDKRTTKSKGYGFVSFSDGDEFFQAARDMQGKYIGSHPVILRRSTTEIKPTSHGQKGGKGKKHHGKGGHGGDGGHGQVSYGGIEKKQAKTKGGLKILG